MITISLQVIRVITKVILIPIEIRTLLVVVVVIVYVIVIILIVIIVSAMMLELMLAP